MFKNGRRKNSARKGVSVSLLKIIQNKRVFHNICYLIGNMGRPLSYFEEIADLSIPSSFSTIQSKSLVEKIHAVVLPDVPPLISHSNVEVSGYSAERTGPLTWRPLRKNVSLVQRMAVMKQARSVVTEPS